MQNLEQLVIRSFLPDQDIPRLLALYSALDVAGKAGEDLSAQVLGDQFHSSRPDPLAFRWVVESPADSGIFIASAQIMASRGKSTQLANILIHPDWRRQGLGSVLLSQLIEYARSLDSEYLQIYSDSSQFASLSFLQKNGFSALGAYTELRLDEAVRLPPVIWPYGYTMRPYSEVQDGSILTEAMNLSYIPLWGHHGVTAEDVSTWLPGFNFEGIFLVFSEKGRVVGVSRAQLSPERTRKNGIPTGCIDAPGVVPQHRRLDLYRALVLAAVRWLRTQDQNLVEMESWGDKLEVLKMYHELGFRDIRQLVCYQYNLAVKDGVK